MTNLPFVYVIFRSTEAKRKFGEMKRFDSAIPKGYPDVLTYLFATNQIFGWCELATDEEAQMYEKAESCRLECIQKGAKFPSSNFKPRSLGFGIQVLYFSV